MKNKPSMTEGDSRTPIWRNPWVITLLIVISIILSVNAGMIYLAIDSNPGLVVEDYYERGQNYEETILSRRALSRNLSLEVEVPPWIERGKPATFQFTGTDKSGRPIHPDAVTLHAYRPSDTTADFSIPMTKIPPATKAGPDRYLAEVVFPLGGVWDIVVAVKQGETEHNVPTRIIVTVD
uniref:Nitrogen fixation protein FixH n=1 Tax=Candidatus Kentrum sp. FW TaxID=2126338 RepID=A0A450U442_9GAMM|nr:MAG: Nitrogen fixation protein FixH [Candidatus Kentron sp. FW]